MSKTSEELKADLAEIKTKTSAARAEARRIANEAEEASKVSRLEADIEVSQKRLDQAEAEVKAMKAATEPAPSAEAPEDPPKTPSKSKATKTEKSDASDDKGE